MPRQDFGTIAEAWGRLDQKWVDTLGNARDQAQITSNPVAGRGIMSSDIRVKANVDQIKAFGANLAIRLMGKHKGLSCTHYQGDPRQKTIMVPILTRNASIGGTVVEIKDGRLLEMVAATGQQGSTSGGDSLYAWSENQLACCPELSIYAAAPEDGTAFPSCRYNESASSVGRKGDYVKNGAGQTVLQVDGGVQAYSAADFELAEADAAAADGDADAAAEGGADAADGAFGDAGEHAAGYLSAQAPGEHLL
eukprot:tig00000076_g2335.t1